MKSFINKILASLSTTETGYSARKLSALWIIILITIVHAWWLGYALKNEKFELIIEILFLDFGFVAAALGMTTYESITKMKNKSPDEPKES